jgi:cyclase
MRRKTFLGAGKLLFEKAYELRKQQTFAEDILCNYLRTKPVGFKFRRQHPSSVYILDFYCHQLKLAIEVDGSIHDVEEVKKNGQIRQHTSRKVFERKN